MEPRERSDMVTMEKSNCPGQIPVKCWSKLVKRWSKLVKRWSDGTGMEPGERSDIWSR